MTTLLPSTPRIALSSSPRAVLRDVKNQPIHTGRLSVTPASGRRKTLLSVPTPSTGAQTLKTPIHSRRHSSVTPGEAVQTGCISRLSRNSTHGRRSSIPKSPMLAFGTVTPSARNALEVPHTQPRPGTSPKTGYRSYGTVLRPQSLKRHEALKTSGAATFTIPACGMVLPTRVRTSLASPGNVSLATQSPCVFGPTYVRRSFIPTSPLVALSSLRTTPAGPPRTPRSRLKLQATYGIKGASTVATTSETVDLTSELCHIEKCPQAYPVRLSSDYSATLALKPTGAGPDATSLFLSTTSFTALKTPRFPRDDTCVLPTVAITGDSPSFLLMETPSFVALRSSSKAFFSPPSYYDLTPSRGSSNVHSGDNTRLLYPLDENESLCATPRNEANQDLDKGLLYAPDTIFASQRGCVPSQSRSLHSLMSALEQAIPSLGRSLFSESPSADTELAGIEDYSFEVTMPRTPQPHPQDQDTDAQTMDEGKRNMNRDTLMLLDEFEILAAETKTLPVPRAPSLSPTEWHAVLSHIEDKKYAQEILDELSLAPSDCTESNDGHSDDSHGTDTCTVTSRPSIDSGRTESPPVTPLDPFFPPIVHVISPLSEEVEIIIAFPPEEELTVEKSKFASQAPDDPATRAPSPLPSRSLNSSTPTPRASIIPRSSPMIRPSTGLRSASSPSPYPHTPHSAIPRSPGLLSATTRTPLHQIHSYPYGRSRSPSPAPSSTRTSNEPALSATPATATGLRRLFKPRQSAPSAFASPLAGVSAGVSRMKKLIPTRSEKKVTGWGDSFLDM